MQRSFYVNHFAPEDQRTLERSYIRMAAFYCALPVLLLAIVTVEIKLLDPQIDAIGLMSTISLLRTNSVGASDAIAAEQVGSVQCALRDLRVVTSIEAHGEARDVPADKLGGAFSAMMNARAACAAGHIGEALAIYDSTIVVPAEPTRN